MRGVVIDVGNSAIKWALLDGAELDPYRFVPDSLDRRAVSDEIWRSAGSDVPVWVSSVAGDQTDGVLQAALTEAGFSQVQFCAAPAREDGLVNSYPEPERMGVDRWFAMLGAWCSAQGPLLVVDAGSALTCDLVAGDGRHLGGYILPGLDMMESSLQAQTQRVRYDDKTAPSLAPGNTTAACVVAGILCAAVGAIAEVRRRHLEHSLILTGGDAATLMALGIAGEWRPNLVLEGLARRARRDGFEVVT